jgi:RNA recognition motif-containing protein
MQLLRGSSKSSSRATKCAFDHHLPRNDDFIILSRPDIHLPSIRSDRACNSETTSIPVNPRTNRPVGYAFVDLETAEEAEKAINELSGKEILERKVSVQLARKPEPAGEKTEAPVSGGEGASGGEGRKRGSGRGRGRGRGRGGRGRGGAHGVCCLQRSFPTRANEPTRPLERLVKL